MTFFFANKKKSTKLDGKRNLQCPMECRMSSDDYQVQDTYRYSRKSFKKSHKDTQDNDAVSGLSQNNEVAELSPRSDEGNEHAIPGRSCGTDPEGEIANILHKKCPVITLAQQQLERLLDETDKLLRDNTRCCRTVYDFLRICKEIFLKQNRRQYSLLALIAMVFFTGMLFGAATCGSYLGRFNSPILTCIDNLFASDTYINKKHSYNSIT